MPDPLLRVFVSATSPDLGEYREVASRVLRRAGVWPVIQEELPADSRSLHAHLRGQVAACQAALCLVGPIYGAAPRESLGPPRSYTQIEYDAAREFGKPVFVLLTSDQFSPERPLSQPDAAREMQESHREALLEAHKCGWFANRAEMELAVSQLVPELLELAEIRPRLPVRYVHPPPKIERFVGRERELEQLSHAVWHKDHSIVLIVGMGGQGKTTMLAEWLRRQEQSPFSAVFWCTAYGGFSFEMFLDELLDYLLQGDFDKRELPGLDARVRRVVDLLQERPTLVVIDGLERWLVGWNKSAADDEVAETAEQRCGHFAGLDDLLEQVSGIDSGTRLVMTTRAVPSALETAAKSFVPVYPEDAAEMSLKGLSPEAAGALLADLGLKGAPDQLVALALNYACHPLALTVLAGLAGKYGGRLDRLPKVKVLDPKRALYRLLDETRENLPGRDAADGFLKVLAHTLGPVTMEVIAAGMSNGIQKPATSSDDLWEQALTLADWNLVHCDRMRETVSLHPLIQQYFAELTTPDEAKSLHNRLSAWFAAQALPPAPTTLEHASSRIFAIEHARRAGDVPSCSRQLFARVDAHLCFVEWLGAWGHQSKGVELIAPLIEATAGRQRASLLTVCASLERQLGSLDAADDHLAQAIGLLEVGLETAPAGQVFDLAGALMNRGNVLRQRGLQDALALFDRALTVLDTLRDSRGETQKSLLAASIRMNRAHAGCDLGTYQPALTDYDAAVATYQALVQGGRAEFEPVLADALTSRANALADLLRFDDAQADYESALVIRERLVARGRADLEPSLAHLLVMRAATRTDAGSAEEAAREVERPIAILQQLKDSGRNDLDWMLALAWMNRGLAHLAQERHAEALEDCRFAVAAYERAIQAGRDDLKGFLAHALVNRSQARFALGDAPGAAEDRTRGLGMLQAILAEGKPGGCATYLRKSVAAALYLLDSEPAQACDLMNAALTETERVLSGDTGAEALLLEATRAVKVIGERGAALATAAPTLRLMPRLLACAKQPS